MHLHLYEFPALDQSTNMKVYLVWGLKGVNISMCDYKNITDVNQCQGQAEWDSEFNINDESVQLGIMVSL